MAIEVICSCGGKQHVPNSYEGTEVKCIKCGEMVFVTTEPQQSVAKPPAAAPVSLAERRLELNNYTIVAKFRPELAAGIDPLLKLAATHIGMSASSVDGMKVMVGWSVLTIRQHVEELHIHEPDFSSDPHKDTREDLSTTLKVMALQGQFPQVLPGVRMLPCTCFDTITAPVDVFQYSQLFLRRLRLPARSDSGLYISPIDPIEFAKTLEQHRQKVQVQDETERMESYFLLKEHFAMLQVLGLPLDYMAQFDGNELITIYGLKNKVVWSKR